jgi:hypothetical protein
LIYQESEVRHAFSLCRVVDAGTADERYDQLGVIQVTVDRRAPDRLTEQLHPWALATLAACGYGFGRYYAALTTLDEDDEPCRPIAQEYIDWSGSGVLVPAGSDGLRCLQLDGHDWPHPECIPRPIQ